MAEWVEVVLTDYDIEDTAVWFLCECGEKMYIDAGCSPKAHKCGRVFRYVTKLEMSKPQTFDITKPR